MSWFDDSPRPLAADPFARACAHARALAASAPARASPSPSAAASTRRCCSPRSRGSSLPRAAARACTSITACIRESAAWARTARPSRPRSACRTRACASTVRARLGLGLEAAAREARYARARGAAWRRRGPAHRAPRRRSARDGAAARPARHRRARPARHRSSSRRSGRAISARPLLGVTRAELRAQARAWGLRWLEDPANADPRHDRSFLRRDVVPALVARWPAAARSAQRLAEQMSDAEAILDAWSRATTRGARGPRPRRRAPCSRRSSRRASAICCAICCGASGSGPERAQGSRSCAPRCSMRAPARIRASSGPAAKAGCSASTSIYACAAAVLRRPTTARGSTSRHLVGPRRRSALRAGGVPGGPARVVARRGTRAALSRGRRAFPPLDRRAQPSAQALVARRRDRPLDALPLPAAVSRRPARRGRRPLARATTCARAASEPRWRVPWTHHPPTR